MTESEKRKFIVDLAYEYVHMNIDCGIKNDLRKIYKTLQYLEELKHCNDTTNWAEEQMDNYYKKLEEELWNVHKSIGLLLSCSHSQQ